VRFLAELLRQAAIQEAEYATWITDLDSDSFEVRARASHHLESAGMAADFALRLTLQERTSPETHKRVQLALDKIATVQDEEIMRLLAHLDPKDDSRAMHRLAALGKAVVPALRRLRERPSITGMGDNSEDKTSLKPSTAWVVEQALQQLEEPDGSVFPLNPTCVLRSLAALAEFNTPESRQVLEDLAQGPAKAILAREAKAILGKMKKAGRSP
jgi:hypothetical protein